MLFFSKNVIFSHNPMFSSKIPYYFKNLLFSLKILLSLSKFLFSYKIFKIPKIPFIKIPKIPFFFQNPVFSQIPLFSQIPFFLKIPKNPFFSKFLKTHFSPNSINFPINQKSFKNGKHSKNAR
jgi:hypothetical protein